VLRNQTHEREERTSPIDGEKQEVDAHNPSLTFQDLKVRWYQPGSQQHGGDNPNDGDRVLLPILVEWVQGEDQCCLDPPKYDQEDDGEERRRKPSPRRVVV
jgi:hypothetical protein